MSEIFWQSDTNFWTIINGKIDTIELGTKTIAETSKCTPIGAYTSFRTYNSFGVLRLTKHLDRLEETARLAGYNIQLDRDALKDTLAALLSVSTSGEKRIRVTIDLERNIGRLYIAMEPLNVPAPEKYAKGIVCQTAEAHRENPKAKLSSFLARAENIREQEKDAFDEILMYTADGDMLEGLSSNFFGITGDTVYTAEEGVLSGTTRDFILHLAEGLKIPVVFKPVKKDEIADLDEAFISSTSRGILPIRTIDGIPMKQSVPGPVTKRLMKKFDEELAAGLESLFTD
ncbi:MAG: aminotransferase class IV family protein [Anaerolineaceae bacterium]|nr:aminotransferase class IV family protein [Anaerolineaceae bacterium]